MADIQDDKTLSVSTEDGHVDDDVNSNTSPQVTLNLGNFTISTVDCKAGQINWYDSIYDFDKEGKQQMCAIMKSSKMPTQNQVGVSGCGVFAMNPSKFIYNQEKMQHNLTECLENQTFCNFPFSINTNWKRSR